MIKISVLAVFLMGYPVIVVVTQEIDGKDSFVTPIPYLEPGEKRGRCAAKVKEECDNDAEEDPCEGGNRYPSGQWSMQQTHMFCGFSHAATIFPERYPSYLWGRKR